VDQNARRDRPITAFVLAGGGSLGAVEVGMLQALVEAGLTPDLVVGASVGAINGVYFAASPDAEGVARLAQVWRDIRRGDVFPLSPSRGLRALLGRAANLVSPDGVRHLLEERLPCRRLEATAVPVHVVATDFASGAEVVLSRGSAIEALLASAAIPAVFPPVELAGRELVDGGIAANTPITAAVGLGARRVIVLPTGFSCRLDPTPRAALGAALHALNLLIARQLVSDARRLEARVEIRVVPPLCPLARSAYDFSGTAELIERALRATRTWVEAGGLDTCGVPGALAPHSH
jgi:NTE family protein